MTKTDDLVERLKKLTDHHNRMASSWSRRENPRMVATHHDANSTVREAAARIQSDAATIERLREALGKLTHAKALKSVRGLVAGWNGEGREDGPFEERHPPRLGAHIETNCGAIYELDEALVQARSLIQDGGE